MEQFLHIRTRFHPPLSYARARRDSLSAVSTPACLVLNDFAKRVRFTSHGPYAHDRFFFVPIPDHVFYGYDYPMFPSYVIVDFFNHRFHNSSASGSLRASLSVIVFLSASVNKYAMSSKNAETLSAISTR